MAGNYITIGSKFEPFTYDEMIRPYQKYGEAYRQQESSLEDLDLKSGVLGSMINQEIDKKTHTQYSNYYNDLTSQAELLSREGLSSWYKKRITEYEISILERYCTY